MASVQMSTSAYLVGFSSTQISAICSPGAPLTKAVYFAAKRISPKGERMHTEIEDIKNAIMLRALRKLLRFDPARSRPDTFINRIVGTCQIDVHHERARQSSKFQTFTDTRV